MLAILASLATPYCTVIVYRIEIHIAKVLLKSTVAVIVIDKSILF